MIDHAALGARMGEAAGKAVARHYGEPADEYAAARDAAVVIDLADRVFLRVHGRDPVRMIQGLITNDLAGAEAGQAVYAGLLTPKGRMVAAVRAFEWPATEVLLEADAGAETALGEHLKKFVPPLFARAEPAPLHAIGVYGPDAGRVVSAAFGAAARVDEPEDRFVVADFRGAEALVVRSLETGETGGFEVVVPAERAEEAWRALTDAGARPAGYGALEVLRIEAGRPRWGAELDESVIPLEAGLLERAISTTKGCYTGQEVIVRVLHRGHVNRHLRGLLLGEAPAPAPGTSLMRPGESKAVGTITSACASPRLGQTIALGYVRREVEPGTRLQVGEGSGTAEVVELPFR